MILAPSMPHYVDELREGLLFKGVGPVLWQAHPQRQHLGIVSAISPWIFLKLEAQIKLRKWPEGTSFVVGMRSFVWGADGEGLAAVVASSIPALLQRMRASLSLDRRSRANARATSKCSSIPRSWKRNVGLGAELKLVAIKTAHTPQAHTKSVRNHLRRPVCELWRPRVCGPAYYSSGGSRTCHPY